ncbi:Tubulin specific chaperone B [Spironucleus salmonicida]|uniref:Tubulin specific chaperone B n=1 Tax=Spironucleus salmonicida TaxID=348837 RepID=V6LKP1_9EUKA|nr:Tubulin specific chaperone B [Spironucleus salmonicida]|eukprot:EST44928.1 Tubulin specific chaperone B [Spironucleus salmonicida]
MIPLHVSHNYLRQRFFEIRFSLTATVGEIKQKIYQITGTQPDYQEIYLIKSSTDRVMMKPDNIYLRDFDPEAGMEISVTDRNPNSLLRDVNDTSKVEKFVLTDAEYDKKENSVRAFLREKYENDPTYRLEVDAAKAKRANAIKKELDAAVLMKITDRCQIVGNRRGEVMYIGTADELGNGLFVGIKLDEPLGDNDGKLDSRIIFDCRPKFGIFVRPSQVEIGDFPEIDELALDTSDSEL